jgi:hypothetical protein
MYAYVRRIEQLGFVIHIVPDLETTIVLMYKNIQWGFLNETAMQNHGPAEPDDNQTLGALHLEFVGALEGEQ